MAGLYGQGGGSSSGGGSSGGGVSTQPVPNDPMEPQNRRRGWWDSNGIPEFDTWEDHGNYHFGDEARNYVNRVFSAFRRSPREDLGTRPAGYKEQHD